MGAHALQFEREPADVDGHRPPGGVRLENPLHQEELSAFPLLPHPRSKYARWTSFPYRLEKEGSGVDTAMGRERLFRFTASPVRLGYKYFGCGPCASHSPCKIKYVEIQKK